MSLRIVYETEPCRRCNGRGIHSRCDTWGTACFKCGSPGKPGSGRQLTRRAREARSKLQAMKDETTRVPIQQLEAGMLVREPQRGTRRVLRVTERRDLVWSTKVGDVEASAWYFVVETTGPSLQVPNTAVVHRALKPEEAAAVAARALKFKGVLDAQVYDSDAPSPGDALEPEEETEGVA